jgi:hypothetical protein
MNKQFKVLVIALILTVIIQLVLFFFIIGNIENRQIETKKTVDGIASTTSFINEYCLEE